MRRSTSLGIGTSIRKEKKFFSISSLELWGRTGCQSNQCVIVSLLSLSEEGDRSSSGQVGEKFNLFTPSAGVTVG